MRWNNTLNTGINKQHGRKAPNGHQTRSTARFSRSDLPSMQKEKLGSDSADVRGKRRWPRRNQPRLLSAIMGAGIAGTSYGWTVSEVTQQPVSKNIKLMR